MDGYEYTIDTYEKFVEAHPELDDSVKCDLQLKIEAMKVFTGKSAEFVDALFNSGAFNDICKGYFKRAMENCSVGKETVNAVLDEFAWLLDTMSAGDVRDS